MFAKALISRKNLLHNLSQIDKSYPLSAKIYMIKADAYGHSSYLINQEIYKKMPNATVALCSLEKALELKKTTPKQNFLLIQGFFDNIELEECIQQQIAVVIHSDYQVKILLKHKSQYSQKQIKYWLKLNTGMNRLGLSEQELYQAYQQLQTKKIGRCIGIMTHFAVAENPKNPLTVLQKERFIKTLKTLQTRQKTPLKQSTANSAAIINHLSLDGLKNTIRPGLMIYGVSPVEKAEINLKPVMKLTAPVISIHQLKKGQSTGYGATWQAPQNGTIAVIKIGYGDGYPRLLSNNSEVYNEGQKYPVVGTISMDSLTIDISKDKSNTIQIGTEIELWGENIFVSELSKKLKTIPYELLTNISPRVKREMV